MLPAGSAHHPDPALARVSAAVARACGPQQRPAGFFSLLGSLERQPHLARFADYAAGSRTHVSRGGKVLSLFWHSSEMLPGASPHVPNEAAAAALLEKIRNYLQWLKESFDVQGVTAAQLYEQAPILNFPLRPAGRGDW